MVDDWRKALDRDELVGSIMLDFSKAFDSINHEILVDKMSAYGIKSGELKWFRHYLSHRKQRVKIKDVYSSWTSVHRGVPQGSILGPVLFLLYVNDLPNAVHQLTVKQFVDDTTVYASSPTPDELQVTLSSDLDCVAQWARCNQLELNTSKTQLLLMSRRRRSQELLLIDVCLNGSVISRKNSINLLGVIIHNNLNWTEHVESVRHKCYIGLSKLRKVQKIFSSSVKK